MSRLDQEHDVIALARELGLRGNPVEAVVRFGEEKIGCWAADFGAVESVAALEQLVADRLQLIVEEGCPFFPKISRSPSADCTHTTQRG